MKMVVVHFNPLEKYPPAVNLLRYLSSQKEIPVDIQVMTTQLDLVSWLVQIKGVKRTNIKWKPNQHKLLRLWAYTIFNLQALSQLIRTQPDLVMYYETLSSWAPVFYKRFFGKNTRLFIHYHEYMSAAEYQSGMVLNRWFHQYEKRIYPFAEWISHTNYDRMKLFKKDIGYDINHTYVMPNYPPISWLETCRLVGRAKDERIGFVYVGALALNTMHTREMAEFVAANPEFCYWDIYSDNTAPEVVLLLNTLNASNISFKGSIAYDDLPGILPKYDVGLILYNGNTFNFAFNAPNKYFEYLACGINVMYGTGMKGMYQYEQSAKKPWTRQVNFESLEKFSFNEAARTSNIPVPSYFAEKAYAEFTSKILHNSWQT